MLTNLYSKELYKKNIFCLEPGLNQRPLDLQSNALPAELSRQVEIIQQFDIVESHKK